LLAVREQFIQRLRCCHFHPLRDAERGCDAAASECEQVAQFLSDALAVVWVVEVRRDDWTQSIAARRAPTNISGESLAS